MSSLPKAPVARIMKSVGATRISGDAVALVNEAMENYGTALAAKANAISL